MERSRALLFVAVVGCLASQIGAQLVGCSGPPSSSTQVATLIASNINGAQGTATITLQMSPAGFMFRVVCLSSSGERNQYRFVSIVAYYTNSNTGVTQYGQFEFECVSSMWSATSPILDLTITDRQTLMANAPAINANIRTDCSYCLNSGFMSPPRFTDTVNHCSGCSGCAQPLCYITDTSLPPSGSNFTSVCCNYYLSDGITCTTACPPSSYPDGNNTCVPCSLTCQNGGTLRSDSCACSCTAVSTGSDCSGCLCQNGGTCSGGTCTCPPGYSGPLCSTCILTCPAGSYLNSSTCSCVPCSLTCQNGGVLRSDICGCNCSGSVVYGGTTCTTCQCQNGGTCSGSVCTCPPGYTGALCDTPCPTSCQTGYYVNNCNCVPCSLTCQNGGVLRSATCTCDCSRSVVYGGTTCTTCQCQNGGTCSGSVCTCPPGYTGALCDTPCPTSCPTGYYLNNCNCVPCSLTCQNGGVLRSATCTCDCSGSVVYGGTSCTTCQCQNGGTCSGSVCTCPPGYTGALCETPCPTSCRTGYYLNNCNCVPCSLTCQNGGVLRSGTCTCDCSGSVVYGGTSCTTCQCQNGGTCSGSVCTCPPGYTGALCETPCPTSCQSGYYLNNCNCVPCSLTCQNGGVLRSATCTCDCSGSVVYGGTTCTTCQCQNGGTCSGSVCTCPPGYTGALCETPCPTSCRTGYYLNNCNCVPCSLTCQNGGMLRSATCTCDCSGSVVYGGTSCTTCQCKNGGTCSGSVCTCPPGYTGALCETPCPTSCQTGYYLNNCNCVPCSLICQNSGVLRSGSCTCDCSGSVVYGGTSCTTCQCQNGGTCSGSVCTCPPGYTGTLCQTIVTTVPPCPSSCASNQYLSACSCANCSASIPNCLQCSSATSCTGCAAGYAIANTGGCDRLGGCCPLIVPPGPTGSVIAGFSDYQGNVAIIIDWGTCTAQPPGGFYWKVSWGDGTVSYDTATTLGPFQIIHQYPICRKDYSVLVHYCSKPPYPLQPCCSSLSGQIKASPMN